MGGLSDEPVADGVRRASTLRFIGRLFMSQFANLCSLVILATLDGVGHWLDKPNWNSGEEENVGTVVTHHLHHGGI